jgi:hypothetical protein
MPCSEELLLMLHYNSVNLIKLMPGETDALCELDRLEPELGRVVRLCNMDMRWLIGIGAEKTETIALDA